MFTCDQHTYTGSHLASVVWAETQGRCFCVTVETEWRCETICSSMTFCWGRSCWIMLQKLEVKQGHLWSPWWKKEGFADVWMHTSGLCPNSVRHQPTWANTLTKKNPKKNLSASGCKLVNHSSNYPDTSDRNLSGIQSHRPPQDAITTANYHQDLRSTFLSQFSLDGKANNYSISGTYYKHARMVLICFEEFMETRKNVRTVVCLKSKHTHSVKPPHSHILLVSRADCLQ